MRGTSDRLFEIDGLRIVAALCVVLYHYTFSAWVGGTSPVAFPAESMWSRYGYLGVDLFFMISGFVVLMSAWDRTPRQFVTSRVIRLYPAYWVGLALTALITLALGAGVFQVTIPQILANLTMFQAVIDVPNVDVVYWTLWAEMRFYVLILLLTLITITKARVMAVLWGWLAVTFAVELGVLPKVADLVVQSEFSHYFIAGMALFLLYRFGLNWQIALIVPLCLGNAVFRAIGYSEAVGRRYHVEFSPVAITVIVTLIFVVMLLVALRVTKPLAKRWLVVAGGLTYPLYLLHAHIGIIAFNRLGDAVNRYVLLFGLVVVMCLAAYAVHRYLETPLAPKLKGLLSPRPQRPAEPLLPR
ncbi:acyltransferase family protein [Nonomuraea typhae]|uniref:acyltransferase family protein n=1 Tax=Nonomuraea typhae TaxID=2603600 RepID=UPI0012FB3E69|nr:acyltransferase [Nonomuraea typhae]